MAKINGIEFGSAEPSMFMAITATLFVSPNGDNTDGSNWEHAYNTITAALDAASTDANECTLILLAPGAYDINKTGDPTWTGNYEIQGSHRNWVSIKNDHLTATAVMKFTGYTCLHDVTIDCGAGSNDGLIMSGDGMRLKSVYVEAEDVTGAMTGIYINGGSEYCRFVDVEVHGVQAHTIGIQFDVTISLIQNADIHNCLNGIKITDADAGYNIFEHITLHACTIGLNLDAGSDQQFRDLRFIHCTTDVDDEVKDHAWRDIYGDQDVEKYPTDLVGVTVNTGIANTYGLDTEIVPANTIDTPFRVVGAWYEPSTTNEWYAARLSHDSGTSFFDIHMFQASAQSKTTASRGSDHIFNAGSRISCSAKDVSGSDNVKVWVAIQRI